MATLSYTNHTLLPEALETWPVELFERLLPRHLDIIYRINVAHLALADARCPGDVEFRASVSLIDERSGRRVRMGQLAFVGSHRINGVSAMHSDLMKETVFEDLNHLYPDRITRQDQRHHLSPLADAGQPEADRSVARGLRRVRLR